MEQAEFDAREWTAKKQIIKYGASGTGKTYTAKNDAVSRFEAWKCAYGQGTEYTCASNIELVQFHPAYGYEDFMEGLQRQQEAGAAALALQNGKFKNFCKKAGQWEIDVFNLDRSLSWEDLTIGQLEEIADGAFKAQKHWQYIFALEDKQLKVADAVPPFFFIADEVNRADLSRVFGELIYCLEYRGAARGQIKTKLSQYNNAATGMLRVGDGDYTFFIPQNVYIIGTMCVTNTSNGGVDIELRRRFEWEELLPDYDVLKRDLEKRNPRWAELAKDLAILNGAISGEPILGSDCCFGHAYLMNLPYAADIPVEEVRRLIWKGKLKPIIQAHLHSREDREELIQHFWAAFSPRIVTIR
ncbi:hypothetical protein IJT17_03740 [bacterium]|nr:hypothetical protein [bacterium]